ncbi:hypothetical protein FOC1_g10004812 [Fusarium oxysporum f. sp. cubense race 1]|uniref:RlpA-like protein double-psi beta-barrel domain-containing protein n=1 Tax=Fusarium oxysporum f. sp. cubense (strain race 1) TaxID=1229664 RepID=N4UKC9_FUSC1|nr:hypothetical protein FOC1_g10004812 [Fusarium oxysporum f. sp. cubense race 1]
MYFSSSGFDAASTTTSVVSSTKTTQTRPDNEISSTVSLDSSSAEVTSATTSNTESVSTATEFSETSTTLTSTAEETLSTSTAPANEQPQIFTGGSATWVYQPNAIPGDCGWVSRDSDFVVALDYRKYDRSKCGQSIRVTVTSGRRIGAVIDVTIVDVCYTCVNENSMDLSTGAFRAFSPLDDAVVNVNCQYLP